MYGWKLCRNEIEYGNWGSWKKDDLFHLLESCMLIFGITEECFGRGKKRNSNGMREGILETMFDVQLRIDNRWIMSFFRWYLCFPSKWKEFQALFVFIDFLFTLCVLHFGGPFFVTRAVFLRLTSTECMQETRGVIGLGKIASNSELNRIRQLKVWTASAGHRL